MSQARVDLLLAHCGDLGIEVEWLHLGPSRRGHYLDNRRKIELNYLLTLPQSASTFAHEFGHAIFRDRCSSGPKEQRAWEYGASLVISRREYAAAEEKVGPHLGALAAELEVEPILVESWRRWYLRAWPIEQRRRLALNAGRVAPVVADSELE